MEGPDLVTEGIANGVAVANLDNDLFPDIFFATSSSNQVWWNNGDQTFTGGVLLGNENDTDVALADLDGDRDADAFAVRRSVGGVPNGYWPSLTGLFILQMPSLPPGGGPCWRSCASG